MLMYILSIVIIVASNIAYNICQKSTPENANPFTALIVTYLTATFISIVAYQFFKSEKGFFESFRYINWTSFALGLSIVGLEFGYLMAYRAGWNISIGSLVANIFLALLLIPVGIFIYKEGFEMNKVIGAVLCIVGLIVINK